MQGIRGASSNSIIYKSSVYLTLKRDSFTKGLAERASNNSVIYKSSVYLTLKRDMLTREHPAKLPSQSWVSLLEERSASRALQAAGSAAAQAPRTWNFSAPRRPRRSEAIHVEHPSNPGALGPWPLAMGSGHELENVKRGASTSGGDTTATFCSASWTAVCWSEAVISLPLR